VNALKGRIAAGQLRGVAADDALARAAGTCAAGLRKAGVNLDAYSSAETASDLDDLRRVLGYRSWNIFGLSYGTRLALTVLRDHPEGIRSVILDSTLPPEVDFDEDASANLWRALDAVFHDCAIDHACGAAWPHLRRDFDTLLARADRAPLRLPPPAIEFDGKPAVVRGAQVVDAIYAALHNPAQIPLIPRIIGEAASGDYRELGPLVRSNQGASSFTWGLRLSVWCGEEAPFEDAARANAQVSLPVGLAGIDERTASPAMCRAWGVLPAPAIENEPVTSDVPVLVLSGEFDPDTPPSWGRGILAHLTNGRFVSVPGHSHGAGFNRCGARVEVAFLKDPLGPLDLGCILAMPGADFAASARRPSGR
jgi:pimeloyl-ACP methyl ester carboxylesterase